MTLRTLGGGSVPTVTKRVTASLSGVGNASGSLTTSGAGSDIAVRLMNTLPVSPTRYRIRIKNYNSKTSTAGGGPLNCTGIYLGTPTFPASGDGRWAGNFTATPTQIVAPFTLAASGTEYVSAWITAPTITRRIPFALSMGFNNTAGAGSVAVYSDVLGGYSYIGLGASAAVAATGAPASLTAQKWAYFDTRLEYEYTTTVDTSGAPDIPVGLFVGDSITAGICGQTTVVPHHHESWVGSAALARKFAPVNIGVSSSKTSDWLNTTSPYWTRVDLATTVPDFAAISIGINDVTTSATAATIQANIMTTMANLRTLGIQRIYLATIMPDGYGSPVSVGGGSVTNTSKTVTVTSTLGLMANMPITGTGIPASTTIASIDSPTGLTLSAAGTATNTGLTLSAGATGVPTATQEAVRVAVNQWIRSVPYGCNAVWDFDKELANPALPGTADPSFISAYPHPDLGGYQRAANVVRL